MTENGNGGGPSRADRRAAILGLAGKLDTEPAVFPGPDGPIDVLVRELSGEQAREWEVAVAKHAPSTIGFLLQLSVIDPVDNLPIFEVADRQTLEAIGISKLNPVLKLAQKLNGISDSDIEQAKRDLLAAQSTG